MNPILLQGKPVELDEMLLAREQRAYLQSQFLQSGASSLICFTLNLAGPRKRCPLSDALFAEGCEKIQDAIQSAGWSVRRQLLHQPNAGCEGFWAVDADPEAVKTAMTSLELGEPITRLFDIDVLQSDGQKLSRATPRLCFLCGQPASVCARSRTHSVPELESYTNTLLTDWFTRRTADTTADTAVRALLYEVSVTPKPGLVDRANNGSHQDMTFFHFLDSATALRPYFAACTAVGIEAPAHLAVRLQRLGREAESTMYRATKGCNTHKGAIFSLGLFCAAVGKRVGEHQSLDPVSLCQTAGELARLCLQDYRWNTDQPQTAGELAYAHHGLTGVRGEACGDFATIQQVYPTFEALLQQGLPLNHAAAITLLHLLTIVQDTNMVKRGGAEALSRWQERLSERLHRSVPSLAELQELDEAFIAEHLSPGGCADLLALILFLHSIAEASLPLH